MATDLTKIAFDSRLNYMKRYMSGSINLTLPASGLSVSHTVGHNLKYIPFFIVGSELNDGSTIWSGNLVYEGTQTSGVPSNRPTQLTYWCDDEDLTITLQTGAGTGDQSGEVRTVYWIIYLDYPDARFN